MSVRPQSAKPAQRAGTTWQQLPGGLDFYSSPALASGTSGRLKHPITPGSISATSSPQSEHPVGDRQRLDAILAVVDGKVVISAFRMGGLPPWIDGRIDDPSAG
jgi:hypothetical protein